MPEKLQTFLVNIAIIEGRHYIWPNMNSAVLIKIDNQKKSTSVKFSTSPYYNEYFVFEFTSTLDKIVDKIVTISVVKPGSILRKRKVLGCTTFDIGTIWYQKGDWYHHAVTSLMRDNFRSPVVPQVGHLDSTKQGTGRWYSRLPQVGHQYPVQRPNPENPRGDEH
jgi:hypothetical protein